MAAPVFSPYSTVVPLIQGYTQWVPSLLEQQRVASYQAYDELYWGVPNSLKLIFRGQEDRPIYLPAPRMIANTMDRYVAPNFGWVMKNQATGEVLPDTDPMRILFEGMMTRERFKSVFASNKLYGVIRGDSLWHITANPLKPETRRISIRSVDPASYFPITADDDVDRIIGCHLVEITTLPGSTDQRIRRQTYRKVLDSNGVPTGGITVEEGIFKLDDWGGPESKPELVVRPPTPLPPQITALPVYHTKNFEEPQNPYGSSELRGYETIFSAIDQSVTDEDLALALDGLGLYVTDAAQPQRDGVDVPWELGPGKVLSIQGGESFARMPGLSSVEPYQAHINMLMAAVKEAATTSDAAIGKIGVDVAESGISLLLQLAPILAASGKKDQLLLDTHAQMFYDLKSWMAAFEGGVWDSVLIEPTIGDKLPVNRTERLAELDNMLDRSVIDTEYYRSEASKLGYVFPADLGSRVVAEKSALADAALGTGSDLNAPNAGVDPNTSRNGQPGG